MKHSCFFLYRTDNDSLKKKKTQMQKGVPFRTDFSGRQKKFLPESRTESRAGSAGGKKHFP